MEEAMVALVFTDVAHPTELFQRLGATEGHRVRSEHFGEVSATVAAHGGELVKTMGDGVMAVFPLATAALNFAVDIQVRSCISKTGRALAGLRVGVSVGQVTASDGDYNGSAVTEAARLCGAAAPGQVLCAVVIRRVISAGTGHVFATVPLRPLRGLSEAFEAEELVWARPDASPLRVVLADDAVVVRSGIARLLDDEGFNVVGEAGDATGLVRLVEELVPDVVVTDIRMPPNMNLDGLEAAERIKATFPGIGVLVLSQHIETSYSMRLLGDDATGVGYLLKERITAIDAFVNAVRRVARGGTAIDPEVVDALMAGTGSGRNDLDFLSEREREVLGLMAEGFSNTGIAERLFVSQRTVESHIAGIFNKLGLPPERHDDRRVLAVVQYLEARQ